MFCYENVVHFKDYLSREAYFQFRNLLLQEGRADSEPLVDDGREVTVVASWRMTPYWGSNDGQRPIFDGARSAWILGQKL